ncbi:4-phosphopantetheinyl transferase, partial [Polaribacter sp.]|nr:4-phosphopantetheinyl transferase [Polaribacter sp.]
MALYKIVSVNKTTKVLIWKIEESISELKKGISLSKNSATRLQSMKSELHQKGFLSIRHLLKEIGYSDFDLIYDTFGKPHLKNGQFISITHSFTFTGIIFSENIPVGID